MLLYLSALWFNNQNIGGNEMTNQILNQDDRPKEIPTLTVSYIFLINNAGFIQLNWKKCWKKLTDEEILFYWKKYW